MTLGNVHPMGFYEEHPEVTWDLAEERWLGYGSCVMCPAEARRPATIRADSLLAICRSCGWRSGQPTLILAKPERQRVAEFIVGSQHWYECPGDPQVMFLWLSGFPEGARPDGQAR